MSKADDFVQASPAYGMVGSVDAHLVGGKLSKARRQIVKLGWASAAHRDRSGKGAGSSGGVLLFAGKHVHTEKIWKPEAGSPCDAWTSMLVRLAGQVILFVVFYFKLEEPDEDLLALEEVVVLVDTFSVSQPIGTKSCMM